LTDSLSDHGADGSRIRARSRTTWKKFARGLQQAQTAVGWL
jgi:hypothetical protein